MATNTKTLHDALEHLSPDGVGVGISLHWLDLQCRNAISAMVSQPRPGINQQIPLPATTKFEAGFNTDPSKFVLDATQHTITLSLDIYLHLSGSPSATILTFKYDVINAQIRPVVDQSTFELFIEPAKGASSNLSGQTYDSNADARLITAGYVKPDGTADRQRFEQEIVYPFVWINGQGLVRAIFRSLPIPNIFGSLQTIRPVVPIKTSLDEAYLLVWSEKALVDLPICGAQKPLNGTPTNQWRLRPGSPSPSSPFDTQIPQFGLYFAGGTLLDWHAELMMPAVMVSHTEGGFIGWRYDAAVGLQTLLVELVPAANGGSIEASAGLAIVGVASAWMNGPCGIRIGLIDGTLQGNGHAAASFSVLFDTRSFQVKTVLDINADIDKSSVHITAGGGGIITSILADLIEWLYRIGVININTQYSRHSDSTLLDATGLLPAQWNPRMRVGQRSTLLACFPKG